MFNPIERILVVDDEPEFVKTLKRHLKREGFAILSAGDGEEARQTMMKSATRGVSIQLVITDVLMPRMDGLKLLEWIKQSHPDTSVLAISGFADTGLALKLIRNNMDEFCQKPLTPSEMMKIINRIGEKRKTCRYLKKN